MGHVTKREYPSASQRMVPTKAKGPKHTTKLQREMRAQMTKLVAEVIDVAEIYSPPRVMKCAERWGLKGG